MALTAKDKREMMALMAEMMNSANNTSDDTPDEDEAVEAKSNTKSRKKSTAKKSEKVTIPTVEFSEGDVTYTLSQVYQTKSGNTFQGKSHRVRLETRRKGREGTSGLSPNLPPSVLSFIRDMDDDTFEALVTDARK